ncbi:non-homologous end joining protein Ku [Brachybacterium paraconglomeratum]|uniref:non-homologous end joining protein Ku n=1 Tax=Brachybacterium paraconglomeratum TaxID=173362 RepID=UPI00223BD1D3|nr:Ku protein [Brachybacterium paraconglomeratum]MCT1436810.1 Ku protein [Brachybacterium paraconglomeratum]
MRAIWSGEITFGLVNVPVKLYGATRSHDISFHQVHDDDHGRIRYERRCEVCGREIDYEHIDKAYEDGDKTVVLSDEELDALPAEESDEIDVVQFVPSDQVDPILLGTSYFLEPVGRSSKAYVLLRRTLEETERTAIVTFTLRTKTRLGVLRVHEDLLALQTLRWPTDLKDVDFGPSRSKVSAKEMEMSAALVEQFSDDFHPEQFTDEYQAELRRLLEAKLEEGDTVDTDATFGKQSSGEDSEEGGKVISLMDALERSVRRRRGGDTGAGDDGEKSGGTTKSGGSKKSGGAKKSGSKKSGSTKKSGSKKSGSTKKTGTAKRSGASKKSA